jgi:RNA polymerase sigma factor for flagellar operon FliA
MHAAKLFANRQIKEIEFEEFKQYALVGLIEAIDRYDAASDASFRTYASHRIKGAILDGIEKYCEKQQQISLRSRLRKERIQSMLRTASETQEVTFDSLVEVSIGIAIGYMLEDSGMYQQEETAYEHNVYKSRELADLVRAMKDLVSKLPEQEEAIIKLHYFQHVQFDQIAESMQMTKGRVSQIHQRALRRLQEHYDQLKLLRTDY